jgi:DNA topoisomerase IB
VVAANGFTYLDVDRAPLTDPAALARIRALAVPPAWRDVWICRTRSGTSRQRAWTPQAAANTATTICGASSRRTRSSSTWWPSPALGNTPAVARGSYIDPRVFDRFLSGWTIAGALRRIEDRGLTPEERRGAIELAVLDLLAG